LFKQVLKTGTDSYLTCQMLLLQYGKYLEKAIPAMKDFY
jgi:hypothetical protein